MDLSTLSLEELKKLRKDVQKAIDSFEERQMKKAREELEEKAREMGYSLDELVVAKTRKKRAPAKPKYRHPDQPGVTWSGRGRPPKWITQAEARGQSRDDFLID